MDSKEFNKAANKCLSEIREYESSDNSQDQNSLNNDRLKNVIYLLEVVLARSKAENIYDAANHNDLQLLFDCVRNVISYIYSFLPVEPTSYISLLKQFFQKIKNLLSSYIEFKGVLIEYYVNVIFEIISNSVIKLCVVKELLRMSQELLKNDFYIIFPNKKLEFYLGVLLDHLPMADVELQFLIVETVFKFCNEEQLAKLKYGGFNDKQRMSFMNIKRDCIHRNARNFVLSFNECSQVNISICCSKVTFDDLCILPPSLINQIWLDFNTTEKTISFFFEETREGKTYYDNVLIYLSIIKDVVCDHGFNRETDIEECRCVINLKRSCILGNLQESPLLKCRMLEFFSTDIKKVDVVFNKYLLNSNNKNQSLQLGSPFNISNKFSKPLGTSSPLRSLIMSTGNITFHPSIFDASLKNHTLEQTSYRENSSQSIKSVKQDRTLYSKPIHHKSSFNKENYSIVSEIEENLQESQKSELVQNIQISKFYDYLNPKMLQKFELSRSKNLPTPKSESEDAHLSQNDNFETCKEHSSFGKSIYRDHSSTHESYKTANESEKTAKWSLLSQRPGSKFPQQILKKMDKSIEQEYSQSFDELQKQSAEINFDLYSNTNGDENLSKSDQLFNDLLFHKNEELNDTEISNQLDIIKPVCSFSSQFNSHQVDKNNQCCGLDSQIEEPAKSSASSQTFNYSKNKNTVVPKATVHHKKNINSSDKINILDIAFIGQKHSNMVSINTATQHEGHIIKKSNLSQKYKISNQSSSIKNPRNTRNLKIIKKIKEHDSILEVDEESLENLNQSQLNMKKNENNDQSVLNSLEGDVQDQLPTEYLDGTIKELSKQILYLSAKSTVQKNSDLFDDSKKQFDSILENLLINASSENNKVLNESFKSSLSSNYSLKAVQDKEDSSKNTSIIFEPAKKSEKITSLSEEINFDLYSKTNEDENLRKPEKLSCNLISHKGEDVAEPMNQLKKMKQFINNQLEKVNQNCAISSQIAESAISLPSSQTSYYSKNKNTVVTEAIVHHSSSDKPFPEYLEKINVGNSKIHLWSKTGPDDTEIITKTQHKTSPKVSTSVKLNNKVAKSLDDNAVTGDIMNDLISILNVDSDEDQQITTKSSKKKPTLLPLRRSNSGADSYDEIASSVTSRKEKYPFDLTSKRRKLFHETNVDDDFLQMSMAAREKQVVARISKRKSSKRSKNSKRTNSPKPKTPSKRKSKKHSLDNLIELCAEENLDIIANKSKRISSRSKTSDASSHNKSHCKTQLKLFFHYFRKTCESLNSMMIPRYRSPFVAFINKLNDWESSSI